jgi:hypothetical protein
MAGKKSKKTSTKSEKKVSATSTFEEKLSATVKGMSEIVKGNDKRHHLR